MEIGEIHRLVEDKKEKEEARKTGRKILEWLSSDDLEETHEKHFSKRLGHTGQWLLDDPRFNTWRDGAQSSILWCYGARKLNIFLYMHSY